MKLTITNEGPGKAHLTGLGTLDEGESRPCSARLAVSVHGSKRWRVTGQAAAQDGASVPPDEPPHDLIPLPADDQEVRDDD